MARSRSKGTSVGCSAPDPTAPGRRSLSAWAQRKPGVRTGVNQILTPELSLPLKRSHSAISFVLSLWMGLRWLRTPIQEVPFIPWALRAEASRELSSRGLMQSGAPTVLSSRPSPSHQSCFPPIFPTRCHICCWDRSCSKGWGKVVVRWGVGNRCRPLVLTCLTSPEAALGWQGCVRSLWPWLTGVISWHRGTELRPAGSQTLLPVGRDPLPLWRYRHCPVPESEGGYHRALGRGHGPPHSGTYTRAFVLESLKCGWCLGLALWVKQGSAKCAPQRGRGLAGLAEPHRGGRAWSWVPR